MNIKKLAEATAKSFEALLVAEKEIKTAAYAAGDYTFTGVCRLFLCEPGNIILRPGMLYYFEVHPDCEKCKAIASSYDSPRDEEVTR
jgi:hypothetical protein